MQHSKQTLMSWMASAVFICEMIPFPVQALVHARNLTASQVPIILWAFTVLRYNPVVAVLSALDRQIEKLSGQMTAQVSSLTRT